jgi:hypothetical protein
MLRSLGAWALALVAILSVAGCNDDPSPVGSGYLPETVKFSSYVAGAGDFEILSGAAQIANSSSQGSSSVLFGSAADGTIAHGLLAITDPIKALEGSSPREVTAVSLRLRTLSYRYGDLSSKQSAFDVVVLDEVALDSMRWSEALASEIAAAPSIGSFSGALPDTGTFTVPLELAGARSFLREYYRYDTTITTTAGKADTVISVVTKKTIALRARSGGSVVASVLGATFADVADSILPALIVTMADSTASLRFGVSSWVADVPVTTGPGRIVVAAGEPVRTYLQLQLPDSGVPRGATIHQARLVLHIDTSASKYGSTGPTTFVVLYDAEGSARTNLLRRSTGRFLEGYRGARDSTSFTDYFAFDGLGPSISDAIRSRMAGGSAVAPFVLAMGRGSNNRIDEESNTVDRLVFYGLDAADPALRPKLTIIYSTQTDAP